MDAIKEIQDPKNRLQLKDLKNIDPDLGVRILYSSKKFKGEKDGSKSKDFEWDKWDILDSNPNGSKRRRNDRPSTQKDGR